MVRCGKYPIPSFAPEGITLAAPLEFRAKADLATTNLVSRMFERWGEIPVEFLQQMDWRHSLYGYVGIDDYTLYPILRPGSFLRIDARQRKILPEGWRNEFERPIYFVELREGYVACWCEVDDNQLVLLPSHQSGQQSKRVRFPGDADIVGRVTDVTMRIAVP